MPHRRAYAPRLLPVLIPACVLAAALNWWLGSNPLIGVGIGLIIGGGSVRLRWMLWRYRHPIITVDERMDEMRKAARWN
jgi:hypothetical protein